MQDWHNFKKRNHIKTHNKKLKTSLPLLWPLKKCLPVTGVRPLEETITRINSISSFVCSKPNSIAICSTPGIVTSSFTNGFIDLSFTGRNFFRSHKRSSSSRTSPLFPNVCSFSKNFYINYKYGLIILRWFLKLFMPKCSFKAFSCKIIWGVIRWYRFELSTVSSSQDGQKGSWDRKNRAGARNLSHWIVTVHSFLHIRTVLICSQIWINYLEVVFKGIKL